MRIHGKRAAIDASIELNALPTRPCVGGKVERDDMAVVGAGMIAEYGRFLMNWLCDVNMKYLLGSCG